MRLAISKLTKRSEHSQALARLWIVAFVLMFVAGQALTGLPAINSMTSVPAIVMLGFLVFSVGIYHSIRRHPDSSPIRRCLAIVMDLSGISFFLYWDTAYAVFYPLYLWVIMGNGFRFGLPYLFFALVVGIVEFGAVIFISDHWRQHLSLAIGLFVGVAVLPLFYSALLRELYVANRKLNEQMREATIAATHDTLTRLPNRALLHNRLTHAMARAQRAGQLIAVMFLDLNGFKAINDSLGHQVGDQLLIGVARRLASCTRGEDTVARWGGDEFIIVLEDINHVDHIRLAAQKFLESLSKPFLVQGHELTVAASMGIAVYPFGEENADQLIRDADAAMYAAKSNGINRYQFSSDMPPSDTPA